MDRDLSGAAADVLGSVPAPMAVVTVRADDGEASGCLVGFLTQCSIDPTRLLVCLSKPNRTHEVAARARHLGVAFVPADRHDVAEVVGGLTGDDVDKLERVPWRSGPHGVPLLDDCPSWVVGSVLDRYDVGDHTAVLVEVVAASGVAVGQALTMIDAEDIEPGHAP